MAKKKQTQQPKSPKMAQQQVSHQNTENAPVTNNQENTAEKLSNLKCLNAMLVTETAMKRQEIGALLDDKKALEVELTRFNSVVDSLRSELTRVMEDKDDLESKKCEGDLEIGKLETLVNDLRGVIERGKYDLGVVMREKEELENGIKVKNEEVVELRKNLVEVKANERGVVEKLDGLMSDYETVTKALRESEDKVAGMSVKCEGFSNEVEGLRKVILEKEGQIGNFSSEARVLREKVEGLSGENEELRKVNLELEGQISNLDNEVHGLRKEAERLREEKEVIWKDYEGLKTVNLELEGHISNLDKEVHGMRKEAERLRGEKEVILKDNEGLKTVNLALEGQISNLGREVCGFRNEVERLSGEKDAVSKDNGRLKTVNLELQGQISNLGEEVCGLRNEVERLNVEKGVVLKDNERLKKVNLELEGQISSLSKEVRGLNDDVLSLREAVEMWQVKFFELEKGNFDVVEELEGLKRDIGVLVEEKKVKEEMIEGLIGEKSINLSMLGELEKEIECLKRVNEEVAEEKNVLEMVKSRQEDKIRELQCEVDEIRGNVLLIQESNKDQLENNKRLLFEINDHKSVLDQVVRERDAVKKTLEEEKMNGVKLQVKVSEISMKMEETAKVIEELRGTSGTLVADKKELENSYTNLAEEKGLIEKNYAKAKDTIAELAGSLKAKSDILESALVMLRNTAVQLSVEKKEAENEGITVNDKEFIGEMKSFMTEVESIWEKAVEMKRETEKLKFCVLDARRKKSFWTLVSSATTILAIVASFAYAKGFR